MPPLRLLCPLLLVVLLLASAGCAGPLTLTSSNEPHTEREALELVELGAAPVSAVPLYAFEAGLDDNMAMVIHIPHAQLVSFWPASPWRAAPQTPFTTVQSPSLDAHFPNLDNTTWQAWKTAQRGVYAETTLADGQTASILVALYQDPRVAVGYVFWHEN